MGNPDLQGIFGIVPTPLKNDASLDLEGLGHLVKHCRESGLHAAVVLGSNGEFPYFTFDEKLEVIRAAGRAADGFPLVAGVSAASTRESVALARAAKAAGCGAVLAALTVYFQPDLPSVKAHYETLARDGGLPVLFYYWPETTGLLLSPDQIAEIAAIPGVAGAKITVANRSFIGRVIELTRTRLWAVFAGTSFLMRFALKHEGAGVLCPLPLIAPQESMALYAAMQNGKLDEAEKIQDQLLGALPLFSGLDMDKTVAGAVFKALANKPYTGPSDRPASTVALVKEALRLQGHPITSVVRAPQPALTHAQADLVAKTMKALGWM